MNFLLSFSLENFHFCGDSWQISGELRRGWLVLLADGGWDMSRGGLYKVDVGSRAPGNESRSWGDHGSFVQEVRFYSGGVRRETLQSF